MVKAPKAKFSGYASGWECHCILHST